MESSAMRLFHSIRRARIAAFAAALVVSSVSAFGQSGQPSFATATHAAAAQLAAEQTAAGPVRRLSIDDAAKLALEQNLGIRIQRIDPQISDVGVSQARSFWAPQFSTSVFRNS